MGRKGRSPKYPQLPLREAIERVAKVHRAERTHKVEREAVARDLGYGSLNGASIGLISTLKEYGLLQEDKEGVRVTDDAVTILRAPEGDHDKEEALRRAAFAPRIFSELNEAYGDNLHDLPGEAALQYRLEKRGFLEKAATEVIRVYRDNLELLSEETAEYTDADSENQQEVELPVEPTQEALSGGSGVGIRSTGLVVEPQPTVAPATVLQFQISQNSSARIELIGKVTQEALDRLAKILEAQKYVFPSEKQPEQRIIEPPAERPAIEVPAPEQAAEYPQRG